MQDSSVRKKLRVLTPLFQTHLAISDLVLKVRIAPKELQHLLHVILEHTSHIKVHVPKLNALNAIQACIVMEQDYQHQPKLASKDTIAQRRVLQQLKLNAEQGTTALQGRGHRFNVLQDFIRTRPVSIVARYAQQGTIAREVFKRNARKELIVRFEFRELIMLN